MRILGEFHRKGGRIERRFTSAERKMIGNLARGLVETLDAAGELQGYDDAVVRRLLPSAAPDDPDAAAEFAEATRARLAESKIAGARRLMTDLDAAPGGVVRLDEPGVIAWLKAIGDLRIALAERVGIDSVQQGTSSPQGLVYAWLTWLQGSLVDAVDAS